MARNRRKRTIEPATNGPVTKAFGTRKRENCRIDRFGLWQCEAAAEWQSASRAVARTSVRKQPCGAAADPCDRKRTHEKARDCSNAWTCAKSFGSNAMKDMMKARRSGGRSQDRPPLTIWAQRCRTSFRLFGGASARHRTQFIERPLQINRDRRQAERIRARNAARQIATQPVQRCHLFAIGSRQSLNRHSHPFAHTSCAK